MAESGNHSGHEATYQRFMSVLKISTVICALIAAFVVWLIA